MASIFPIELFLDVASFIERRNDLFALAFTCHALYNILVPDYVDFIELKSPIFNNALWTRSLKRPILCDRVRSLKLTDTADGIHHDYRYHLQEILLPSVIAEPLVYTVLPHLENLRRFQGFFNSSSKISLSRLAQCLKHSGCILEELDLDIRKSIYADYRSIRCSSISSFALEMPSLKRVSISVSDYDKSEADGLIQMLSRLPNLSYLNLSPPNRDHHINDFLHNLFTKCNWPKLKHMVLKQIYQPNVIVESYGSHAVSNFFVCHPELESFYIDNMLFPGCFPKDATCPKLKALHFMFPNPAAAVFVQIGCALPSYMAKNLVHLSLIGVSNVRLGIEPNGLCSLETCSLPRIVSETQLSWMAEFVKAAPNLKKCSVSINSCFDNNAIIRVIQLFSALKDLTHLINLLSKIDISEKSGLDIFKCLYEIPSLIYFNATIRSEGRQFIRILRMQPQLSYEIIPRSIPLVNHELDYTKWGGFH